MTVLYRLEPTGRTAHEVREILLTTACPTCGADWRRPRVALPRGSQRSFLCTACDTDHPARKVHDDEEGPATHKG